MKTKKIMEIMRMKKAILFLMLFPLVALAGNVSVSSVTVQQRYPWSWLILS